MELKVQCLILGKALNKKTYRMYSVGLSVNFFLSGLNFKHIEMILNEQAKANLCHVSTCKGSNGLNFKDSIFFSLLAKSY